MRDDGEKLLFFYLKPVPDYYSLNQIHWYEGVGKSGKSSILWPALSIRQWVACGTDTQISSLLKSILSTSELKVGNVKIGLKIPPYSSIVSSGINKKRCRSEVKADLFKLNDLTFIPQEFYQKENLELLSGYKKRFGEMKSLFPIGFFEDGFIYRHLGDSIFGVLETRTPYLTFHGVRSASEKGIGTNTIVGFYQKEFDQSEQTAVVKDEGGNELGRGRVDNLSGFFKVNLSKPNKSGSVEIVGVNNIQEAINYHFIQDIQITGHIADTSYRDPYGRSFMVSADMRTRPTAISSATWQQSVFANSLEANSRLADLFKQVFDYLGPKIVVADPYFLGNFEQDDITKALTVTHCQQAIIAAMIHSAVEKGISQFAVLGCSRATNQLDNDPNRHLEKIEVMIERYEKLFKQVIEVNKLRRVLAPASISFSRAVTDFHNRYWFSIVDSNGFEVIEKCVVVTNSIGNISEVDIIPITDNAQIRQIALRYLTLYKNAKLLISI